MINSIEEILILSEALKRDYDKLVNKNNKAAGKRVRKWLLEMMKNGKAGRKAVSAKVAAMPKKREKK